MDRTDWLEWRRGGIGASDIVNIAHNTRGGAYTTVHNKLTGDTTDIDPDLADRGHRWEPRIATVIAAAGRGHVQMAQLRCQNATHPWMRCTLDGMIWRGHAAPDVVAEFKTVDLHAPRRWDEWDTQVQWQMAVTGCPNALLAVAVIDTDDDTLVALHLRDIPARPSRQAELHALASEAWAHVEAGTYPAPDAEALLTVRHRHNTPLDGLDPVELDPDLVDQWRAARALAAAHADEAKTLEAQIREAVGAAKVGVVDGFEVRVGDPVRRLTPNGQKILLAHDPTLARPGIDTARARKLYPDLYDQHTAPTDTRLITIKETR